MKSSQIGPRNAARLSRSMMIGLAALCAAPLVSIGVLRAQTAPTPTPPAAVPATQPTTLATSPWITESKTGPWGTMQLVPIVLELPDEYANVAKAVAGRDRWNFAGMSRAEALTFLVSCGLTTEQLALIRDAVWTDLGTSSSVVPSDGLVLSLSPAVRSTLYARLMPDPANKSSIDPSWWRVGKIDMRLRGSGLSESSTNLVKSLLYTGDDDTLLFNDIKPSLRSISDPAEQLRFLKAVTRKRSLMARIIVDADSDTTALAAYWGRGGRAHEIVPLLDSLKFNAIAGIENPSRINISTLVPQFVQERLYHHADNELAAGREAEDCFWTAFNFFNAVPDERIHDVAYLAALMKTDYDRIDAPSQLGDVILIADADGDILHAANFIADDVVFTKNGFSNRQPWMLAQMKDLISQYRIRIRR